MDYRHWVGACGVMAGLVVVVINYVQGDVAFATILLVLVAFLSGVVIWWTRAGRDGPHVRHAVAQATAGDGDVIIYWRPG